MDRARLFAGGRPRFPSRKTRLLLLRESLGRRAAATVGSSHGGPIADIACARRLSCGIRYSPAATIISAIRRERRERGSRQPAEV